MSTPLSEGVDEPVPETWTSTAALTQYSRFRLYRFGFELFDRRRLSIRRERAFGAAREYHLDIRILDPAPRRRPRISRLYPSAVLVAAAATGLTRYTDLVPAAALLPTLLWAGAGAGILTLLAACRSQDRLVFYSRNGRAPLVVLLNGNPDRRTFQTFVDSLTQCIREAREALTGGNDALSYELQAHRRLLEQGAISEKRYAQAKQRLLGLHR